MNMNVSDNVAGVVLSVAREGVRRVRMLPQRVKIEALLLNQRHSHITLLLTLPNLFFTLRNSLSSLGRSYLKIERAPQTISVAFSTAVGTSQLHSSLVQVLVPAHELHNPGRVALVQDDLLSNTTWIENSWSGKGLLVSLGTLFAAGPGSSASPLLYTV
jgi:hypothetical protein